MAIGGGADDPGLDGVQVATTSLGDVRGAEGFFHYRQYDAVELARKRTFEDVWYLQYESALPDAEQSRTWVERLRHLRHLPVELSSALSGIARTDAEPVPKLQAAYTRFLIAQGLPPTIDISPKELQADATATCAALPTLVAALFRLERGVDVVPPSEHLSHAANFLYMLSGEPPTDDQAKALERYLIATIDHGFNASTFTARVITSTGADLGSAVLGALGALSGPLHGGAPSRALGMLRAIGSADKAEEWLRNEVRSGRRLMGFGHRIYKTDDPRSVMLREVAESLDIEIVHLAKHVERVAVRILEEEKPGRALYPNVEFYAGVVLENVGVPSEFFTSTFAISRVVGWTAHILEQAANNRLIRPSARYVGPEPPVPVPAAQ